MKYCQKCGSQNPDVAVFCSNCGATLSSNTPSPKEPKIIKIYNAVYGYNEAFVFAKGKMIGHIYKQEFIKIKITENTNFVIKVGEISKECYVAYDNPGSIVFYVDNKNNLIVQQCDGNNVDYAISIANDNNQKIKSQKSITAIVCILIFIVVILCNVL